MKRYAIVFWCLLILVVGSTLQADAAGLIISQYYEGTSNNKWIEIFNATGDAIDLAAGGYRLGQWSNANRELWKTGTAPSVSVALTNSIAANATYLVRHSSATNPAYATADLATSSLTFNGDDSVVLYTGSTYAFANVVDAIGMTATQGLDRSFVRKTTVTTGVNTDFNAADWDEFSNAAVDAAAEGTNERLGYHSTGGEPPPVTTNVKFTASSAAVNEDAGTYVVTVIKTLAEGDVSGEIGLSGTATYGGGADYTVDTTNFTMNGTTTSATFTVTLNDDEDQESAETVILTLGNVVGGTTVSPSAFTLTISSSDAGEPAVWINEINYDPAGTDDADTEWLEVAGPAGTDLSEYLIVGYNGSGGVVYRTDALSGTIDDEGCGYGAVDHVYSAANSLQNGAPDGLALAKVSGGVTTLVQFLSYEGSFAGVGGPADGVTSVDIGVLQPGTNDVTVQLVGTATNYSGFAWITNTASRGDLNVNQSITGCTASPQTNVKFTASAAAVDENAGTYQVTVFKTLAEGDVSGEIGLSGTATEGGGSDYTVDTTNFTLNGTTTSAVFTVTINDDGDEEPAETVILTIANVTGGGISTPSVFTLTINANDVPPPPAEGILAFRFNTVPYLQVTTKDDNLTVSDVSLTAGTIEVGVTGSTVFVDRPYIEETGGWTADNQAAAKAFQFTVTPAEGASITVTGIAFRAAATTAGPSAIGYNIAAGAATFAMDMPAALVEVTQAVAGVENQTGPFTVLVQGWTNGSRVVSGAGAFRLDDVVLFGSVTPGVPQTNVRFTASAAAVDENAGTYQVTVVKTLAEGDVSGEIGLSGTATEGGGADYTVDTTNFTMNGTTTSATFTVTINDDADEEAAETVILTIANVTGGGISTPSVFTLTINASDAPPVPAEGILSFRFDTAPYLQVTTKDAGLAVSDMSLTAGTIESGLTNSTVFVNRPYIEETGGWTADNQAAAKAFQFTVTPEPGSSVTITAVAFRAYATSAGPSAIGYNIAAGTATFAMDMPAALVEVTQAVAGVENQTDPFVVMIQGWTNASRVTSGGGVFRLDDVVLYGSVAAGSPQTNVRFTASAASIDEGAGDYIVTVVKTLAEGDVSGEIGLSGTAVNPDDYVISATNFTLNGATTSTTFTITVADDADEEAAETVILTIGNVTGGGISTPSTFTLTINANDAPPVPPEGIAAFRFTAPPYFDVTTKDDNLTVSAMSMTVGTIATNAAGTYFPNEPYAQSTGGWAVDNQAGAKAFQFTLTPAGGYSLTVTGISFRAYATSAGPSAFGFNIGSGLATWATDMPSALLVEVTQTVAGVVGQTDPVVVMIQGWTNGSRVTTGGGDFRLDDVVIYGSLSAGGPSVYFFAASVTNMEDAGAVPVTIYKSAAEGDVSGYVWFGGSADQGFGADYTIDTTNYTMNGATTSATINITINDDASAEDNETVVVNFGPVTGGVIGNPSIFTLTILDNDAAPPPEPELGRFVVAAGGIATARIENSQLGVTYKLQWTSSLWPAPVIWTDANEGVGNGGQLILTDPAAASGRRIYRVVVD